jgi:hypothetical protein
LVIIALIEIYPAKGIDAMKTSGKTGEKVKVTGVYKNRYGREFTLQENTLFPPCPDKGQPTVWEIVEL